MGKLRELREKREQMDWEDPERKETEKEINRIEQWCIDNDKGFVTKLTVFGKNPTGESDLYPWHTGFVHFRDIFMVGTLNGTGINYNADKTIHHCELCANI